MTYIIIQESGLLHKTEGVFNFFFYLKVIKKCKQLPAAAVNKVNERRESESKLLSCGQ